MHEDDIAYMKKELSEEECAVVMKVSMGENRPCATSPHPRAHPIACAAVVKASKLVELCARRGLQGLSPATVRTSAFPYQTIADADIFGACSLFLLRPNPKPMAHFATLPGTERRPLKVRQARLEVPSLAL